MTDGAADDHAGTRSVRATAEAIVDLSRTRQALLSVAQPALAALIAAQGMPSMRVIGLGLIAASTGFLAVFSLNDVLDRHVDAESLAVGKAEVDGFDIDTAFVRHPLARGDLSLGLSLVWVGGLGVVSATCAFVLSPACLALFATAVALEIAYCALRSVTWLKTVVSGVMVGVGGLAGWAAVAPLTWAALPTFSFLALWEIGGRNLPNDLADLASDSRVGIRSVATVFGPHVSAISTLAVGVGAAGALVLVQTPMTVRAVSVALAVWAMTLPAVELVRDPTSEQAGRYFNRASLLPALVFAVVLLGFLAPASGVVVR